MNYLFTTILVFFIFLNLSCDDPNRKIPEENVVDYDNLICENMSNENFIDSLIDEFPDSEYLKSRKMLSYVYFGKIGKAWHYLYEVLKRTTIDFQRNDDRQFTPTALMLMSVMDEWGDTSRVVLHGRMMRQYYDAYKSGDVWTILIMYYYHLSSKDYIMALRYLNEAYELFPSNVCVLEKLIDLNMKMKKYDDVDYYLNQLPENYNPLYIDKIKGKIKSTKLE